MFFFPKIVVLNRRSKIPFPNLFQTHRVRFKAIIISTPTRGQSPFKYKRQFHENGVLSADVMTVVFAVTTFTSYIVIKHNSRQWQSVLLPYKIHGKELQAICGTS